MVLHKLSLQNFRSYDLQTFAFSPQTTVIIGKNTAGKTNLTEALMLLSIGKSFHAEKDMHMVTFEKSFMKVKGKIVDDYEKILEVTFSLPVGTDTRMQKKYVINSVPKRRIDFVGNFPVILFNPEELDIIIAGPAKRRKFIDELLIQVDRDYRNALVVYEKALKQRNALLLAAKVTGIYNEEQFSYWDTTLISSATIITKKRQALVDRFNNMNKKIIDVTIVYDSSIMSQERLLQYTVAERSLGITLVGPQRDDLFFTLVGEKNSRFFASRGQQRLIILQLKLLQLDYIESVLDKKPLLILDDIFSELDQAHMALIMSIIGSYQTILTTTHEEFIANSSLANSYMIKL